MAAARRVFVAVMASVAVLAAGASPAQATTTIRFEATFSVSGVGCGAGVIACGTGFVAQFGSASAIVTSQTTTPAPPCTSATVDATITLTGGTLTTTLSTLRCSPGEADAVLSSGSFAITGGTGVFAGASGGGTVHSSVPRPGEPPFSRTEFSGTLTLP